MAYLPYQHPSYAPSSIQGLGLRCPPSPSPHPRLRPQPRSTQPSSPWPRASSSTQPAPPLPKRKRPMSQWQPTATDLALLRYSVGRMMGLRSNRYSWWTHWRELADFFLPRRYKWLVTPNQMGRGSPINQHTLDSTGVIA